MADGRIADLDSRGVVAVGGPDAAAFLDNLLTTDASGAGDGRAVFAALLAPQGKILFDFIVFRDGERFLLDVARSLVPDLVKRLGMYRLRAKVEVADLSDDHAVVATWGGDAAPILDGPVAPDPRLAALGWRGIVPAGADMAPDHVEASAADYEGHRIALGIPAGGADFAYGDAFPHDAAMDHLNGVDFRKGCFIGQEVVSRMQHRGTARRRPVAVHGTGLAPGLNVRKSTSTRMMNKPPSTPATIHELVGVPPPPDASGALRAAARAADTGSSYNGGGGSGASR